MPPRGHPGSPRARYHHAMADKGLTYGTYLRIPELLGLQKTLSSPPHHDEALFIVIHQVYELWFKLVLHEVDSAAEELDQDHVYEGTRLLRRVVEIQRLLIHQVRILETMRPQDFLGFRYHLNPASGFQSIQFREIEFRLGLKDPAVLERLVCEPAEKQRLERAAGRSFGGRHPGRAAPPPRPRAAAAPPRRRHPVPAAPRTGAWTRSSGSTKIPRPTPTCWPSARCSSRSTSAWPSGARTTCRWWSA